MRLVMICNPRGGISSKLTIDSDWKNTRGEENSNDWKLIEDEMEVRMYRSAGMVNSELASILPTHNGPLTIDKQKV